MLINHYIKINTENADETVLKLLLRNYGIKVVDFTLVEEVLIVKKMLTLSKHISNNVLLLFIILYKFRFATDLFSK